MAEDFAHLPGGITICFESFGDPADPAVLLVMGLGCPMGWWNTAFCDELTRRGFRVIRFDNRDTGRSTHLSGSRVTRRQVVAAFAGLGRNAPYSISDLAEDAVGLLDHLRIDSAHLVGASMGGMIVQALAIEHPERAASLTSMMSTTGRRTVGWQHPRLLPNLFSAAGPGREDYVAHSTRMARSIGSPGFAFEQEMVVERARETFDRGRTASGVMRQLMAVLTQPDRTLDLSRIDVPTCVIHGTADPMVHLSGGRATARAVRDAELVTVPGMGHDLPREVRDVAIDAIARTARRTAAPPTAGRSRDESRRTAP